MLDFSLYKIYITYIRERGSRSFNPEKGEDKMKKMICPKCYSDPERFLTWDKFVFHVWMEHWWNKKVAKKWWDEHDH